MSKSDLVDQHALVHISGNAVTVQVLPRPVIHGWAQTVSRDDGSCNPDAGICVCFAHTGYVESIRDD